MKVEEARIKSFEVMQKSLTNFLKRILTNNELKVTSIFQKVTNNKQEVKSNKHKLRTNEEKVISNQ